MSNQTLSELAKKYATGKIDKNDYRKSRETLISAIMSGKINVEDIDFPLPLLPLEKTAVREKATEDPFEGVSQLSEAKSTPNTTSSRPPLSAETNKKSPLVFIITSIVIVISLIVLIILFYPKPPSIMVTKTTNTSNNTQTIKPIDTVNINVAGGSLIAYFLTQNNWTEVALNTFIDSWSALPQKDRDMTNSTKRMQRLHNSIFKQFLEANAMSSINKEKAIIKQKRLIKFAEAIGIDDSRLTLN